MYPLLRIVMQIDQLSSSKNPYWVKNNMTSLLVVLGKLLSFTHIAAAANHCAWVTGEDIEEEDEEVFSLTHKLPLVVESTRLNMVDKSTSVS